QITAHHSRVGDAGARGQLENETRQNRQDDSQPDDVEKHRDQDENERQSRLGADSHRASLEALEGSVGISAGWKARTMARVPETAIIVIASGLPDRSHRASRAAGSVRSALPCR